MSNNSLRSFIQVYDVAPNAHVNTADDLDEKMRSDVRCSPNNWAREHAKIEWFVDPHWGIATNAEV